MGPLPFIVGNLRLDQMSKAYLEETEFEEVRQPRNGLESRGEAASTLPSPPPPPPREADTASSPRKRWICHHDHEGPAEEKDEWPQSGNHFLTAPSSHGEEDCSTGSVTPQRRLSHTYDEKEQCVDLKRATIGGLAILWSLIPSLLFEGGVRRRSIAFVYM